MCWKVQVGETPCEQEHLAGIPDDEVFLWKVGCFLFTGGGKVRLQKAYSYVRCPSHLLGDISLFFRFLNGDLHQNASSQAKGRAFRGGSKFRRKFRVNLG